MSQIVPSVPRAIEAKDRLEGAKNLIDAVGPVFQDLGSRVFDYPGFIASDDPITPLGNAVRQVARFNCRSWAAADKSNYSTRVNAGNAELCSPYLESIGENPTDGSIAPPFEGGQCPVEYRASFTATGAQNNCEPTQFSNPDVGVGVGPISLRFEHDTDISQQTGGLCPGFSYNVVYVRNAAGETPFVGQGRGIILNSFSLRRADNQPDVCGDPAPIVRAPGTVIPVTPLPPSIRVDLPGIGDTEVNVNLDINGDPEICILSVCTKIEIGGDGDGDGGDGGDGGAPPGDVGDPGDGASTGVGGDAEGEAPEGSVLTGLKLDLVTAPTGAREYAPGVYRAGAYIYMGTPAGLDQDYAGSMLTDGQFVFAEKDNLTKWRVQSNVGFNWFVTPYYREVT